jgi:hypothetical protein
MKRLIMIVVEDDDQVADIVSTLTQAEEEGQLDFPFGCAVLEAPDCFSPLDLSTLGGK